MCVILYTLLLSLVLGSSIQHLQSQETVTDGDLMTLGEWTTAYPKFISHDNNVVTSKDPVVKDATLGNTNDQRSSTTMNPTVMKATETITSTFVTIASSETASLTASPEDTTTTSDLKTYTTEGSVPTSTTIPITSTTVEPTTKLLESTTLFTSSESTVLTSEEATTKTMQTISQTTPVSISTSPFNPKISTHIPAKSTQSRMSTTTSTSITSTYEQPLTPIPKTEDNTTDSTMISTPNGTVLLTVESDKSEKSFNLKIIIIALVGFCVLMIVCIGLAMRHKKNSGKQNFGQMNGRSKKKKGAEDDVWAGPVNLGGVEKEDCSSPEEALVQGEDKPDCPEVMLSTFTMPDDKAAVGRPGSQEVKRWEEQERLLYIDEDTKGEEKDKETDQKMQQNGGEAYCLTTAV